MRDVFNEIGNATASRGGEIIRDGRYSFIVKKIEVAEKYGGYFFIAELYTTSSQATESGVEPNAIGSSPSIRLNLDKNPSAKNNAKAFVLALLGVDEKDVDPTEFASTLKELNTPAQPARGMPVACETFRKAIKGGANAGKPFVGQTWKHVNWTNTDVSKNREMLDDLDRNPGATATAVEAPKATGGLLNRR